MPPKTKTGPASKTRAQQGPPKTAATTTGGKGKPSSGTGTTTKTAPVSTTAKSGAKTNAGVAKSQPKPKSAPKPKSKPKPPPTEKARLLLSQGSAYYNIVHSALVIISIDERKAEFRKVIKGLMAVQDLLWPFTAEGYQDDSSELESEDEEGDEKKKKDKVASGAGSDPVGPAVRSTRATRAKK